MIREDAMSTEQAKIGDKIRCGENSTDSKKSINMQKKQKETSKRDERTKFVERQ